MLKTNIQASAINNLTDARYFAAREAKWLCFDLDDNSISLQAVAAIKEWVDGMEIVGAFSIRSITEITAIANDLNLDFVQLGMFYNVSDAKALIDVQVIKQVIIDPDTDWRTYGDIISEFEPHTGQFLLDLDKNVIRWQDLTNFQLEQLRSWCASYRIVLSLPFEKNELESILSLNPYGINLKGGEEEKVGFKSFDDLDDILDDLVIEED